MEGTCTLWLSAGGGCSSPNSAGYYRDTGSSSTHVKNTLACGVGTYSTDVTGICASCPAGQHQSAGSHFGSSCSACGVGQHQPSTGSSSCINCHAGEYQATSGGTSCSQCGSGQYSAAAGAETCTSCEAGQFRIGAGALNCEACPTGRYSSVVGTSSCSSCAPGQQAVIQAALCSVLRILALLPYFRTISRAHTSSNCKSARLPL